jgi:hypothetical protein
VPHDKHQYASQRAALCIDANASCHDSAAQPGIAADRFAREIVGFLKVFLGALAAAECQPVGRR